MFSNQSAELSLDTPCRSLVPVRADRTESRFLIGTHASNGSSSSDNFLHVIRFHTEVNELSVDAQIPHYGGPVEAMETSPNDPTLVWTSSSNDPTSVNLYQLPRSIMTLQDGLQFDPDEDDALQSASSASMELQSSVDNPSSVVTDIQWRACDESNSGDVLFLTRTGHLTHYDVGAESVVQTRESSSRSSLLAPLPRVAWDPHSPGHAVAVTDRHRVHLLDWRTDTSIPTGTIENLVAHRAGGHTVTALDYNPNKPFVLSTAGTDGRLYYWDTRYTTKHYQRPLLVTRGGHSHWVTTAQYNPFHDQLVLSAGTDGLTNLWRLSTISSAPLLTLNDDEEEDDETKAPNARIARLELVGDSIYGACWSAADAWMYMMVGYSNGKVILNHVPSKEKYKILL